MIRLVLPSIVALLFSVSAFGADSSSTKRIEMKAGRIHADGQLLVIKRSSDQTLVPFRSAGLRFSHANPGYYLSVYWDSLHKGVTLTRHLVVADATGKDVVLSNSLDSGLEFEWVDNNFAVVVGDALYFGVFEPQRMQFVYRRGILEIDNGPWRGPEEPEIYNEPDKSLPCANVANVPACLEEVERNRTRLPRPSGSR